MSQTVNGTRMRLIELPLMLLLIRPTRCPHCRACQRTWLPWQWILTLENAVRN